MVQVCPALGVEEMNDDTFWSSGAPPAKRKRFSHIGTAAQEPSKVEDMRVAVRKGIRYVTFVRI